MKIICAQLIAFASASIITGDEVLSPSPRGSMPHLRHGVTQYADTDSQEKHNKGGRNYNVYHHQSNGRNNHYEDRGHHNGIPYSVDHSTTSYGGPNHLKVSGVDNNNTLIIVVTRIVTIIIEVGIINILLTRIVMVRDTRMITL